MKVSGESASDADQRKEMTLDLTFQGEAISGTAKISGYDDFQVTGKVLARGMEMELKNGIYWVRLTSGPKDKKIRGLYTFPAIQKKGNWEVVMVK